ncbi:MAG: hypothetical protein ACE5HC_05915 [Candidatus Binatia bacterium]
MVTKKQGEEAVGELEQWADRIVGSLDDRIKTSVYYDPDSSTYVIRLARDSRVLLFRLSEAQLQTDGRSEECEKILKTKIKNISG